VCRSWEGAQPGSQPKLASGNIPYHRRHAQFINGAWWEAGGGGVGAGICSSLVWEFESSLVQEFKLFGELRLFAGIYCNSQNLCDWGSTIAA